MMGLFHGVRKWVRRRAIHKQVKALKQLTLGQIMTKYVITVRPDDEVIKAATKMIAEDISCLVVADGDKAVGILSERDFLKKVPLSKEVFKMRVKDIMTPDPVVVPRSTRLPEAVALMKKHGFRRLIIQEEGKLLGIATQTDFTKTIKNAFDAYPVAPEVTLGHIMSKQVLTVTPKSTVAQVKQKMLKANVGAIIIVDKEKDPVPLGIFTEYDVVMQFYDQRGKLEMKDISSYMRKYVRAMPSSETIFEANRLMLDKNMRRLLVVEGTKIVGIVTQTDICRYTYDSLDAVEKAADKPDNELKRFSWSTETHGEFRGEHLKVYDIE